ncbi:MAG: D-TA family PLP-dependent enzyme [Marinosulfonomonas sp.]
MNRMALDTPEVLVDLDIAEKNIRAFQDYCDSHGLKLRPHIKTHKLPFLAQEQLAAGAIGITCQKISEAEAMLETGQDLDVLLTYNILGAEKTAQLRKLAQKVKLSVVADSPEVVASLSRGFAEAPQPMDVLVECNTGADRCGVDNPAEAAELAKKIKKAPGLTFKGLMTYPPVGGTQNVLAWLSDAKSRIEADGLTVEVISSGGSPDMWHAHEMPLATEYRIGTYIYNDRSLVLRGTCDWDDCALSVLATVVSVPSRHRAIIDAGSKVLTSDLLGLTGYGHVLGHPDYFIDQLSEEHGRITSEKPIDLTVGQRIRIIPNHACVVSNMLDRVTLTRGETVERQAPVTARGQVW